jgi:hypothetical protein
MRVELEPAADAVAGVHCAAVERDPFAHAHEPCPPRASARGPRPTSASATSTASSV